MVGGLTTPDDKPRNKQSVPIAFRDSPESRQVSIVIAARNNEKYLAETIESALQQSIPCEVIYADDNSIDDSVELAQQ